LIELNVAVIWKTRYLASKIDKTRGPWKCRNLSQTRKKKDVVLEERGGKKEKP